MYSIEEGKRYLRDNFDAGVKCPCCQQMVKRYKRKLTSGMAIGLLNLYKQSASEFVHISKLGRLNGGEFAQLERWGIIEEAANDAADMGRTSGSWRITAKGIRFVKRQMSVPGHVYTYNGDTLGFSEDRTNIDQALGNKFSYREIMGDVAASAPIVMPKESEEDKTALMLFPD